MTLGRAIRWTAILFFVPTLLSTVSWLITGDWSFDIGVTFALLPALLVGLYLGYRMVKAGIGDLMPFVVGVVAVAPAVTLGWCAFQLLRYEVYGERLGPMPVERYAELRERNAVRTRLRGRLVWSRGAYLEIERGGEAERFTVLPFVPVSWSPGQPVPLWVLGTGHRYKQHDFDDCPYKKGQAISEPCTLSLYEPRMRGLRLRLIHRGKVPRVGGMDFVVLRADVDRLWLPRRLALGMAPLWFLLCTLWIWRLGRGTARRQH